MKKNIYSALLVLSTLIMFGQNVKKTIGNYSSELQSKEVKGKSRLTKVFYYPNSGLLKIEDNLSAISNNDFDSDTTNSINNTIIPLKFQTTIQGNLSQIFKENKYANLIRIEGTLTINGISKECVAYYAPVILNAGSGDVLIDFDLKFDLNDFNIPESALQFKGLTEFEIEDGYIIKIDQ